MKVYFYSSNKSVGQKESKIFSTLSFLGAQVASNLSFAVNGVLQGSVLKRTDDNGETFLSKIDVLIIDGTYGDPSVAYFLASAISNSTPVLLLMPMGLNFDSSILMLKNNARATQFLSLKNYTDATLPKVISTFINKIQNNSLVDQRMIKFTLRITPAIDRYLGWKAKGKSIKKADFLRNMIEEIMEKDEEYSAGK